MLRGSDEERTGGEMSEYQIGMALAFWMGWGFGALAVKLGGK